MPRPMTMEEIDAEAEERDRQKDLMEELSMLTPETASAEYRNLVGEDAEDGA